VKAPNFWQEPESLPAKLLSPLGWIYAEATARRLARTKPWQAPIPVICVGNLTAGGAGKTPVVRDLAQRFSLQGRRPAILTRGYGGRDRGPLLIDPARHDSLQVGDESLLLSGDAPCWVAADRAAGGRAIAASGAGLIIMDDGLQNPDLRQDLRLVVVDGVTGFGNGRAIPAGPLRERPESGLPRADAAIVIGEPAAGLIAMIAQYTQVLQAHLTLPADRDVKGARLIAFAGIGRPKKFRRSLVEAGAEIVAFHSFGDHHPYAPAELDKLAAEAARRNATLVTTEKDWMRLDPSWRTRIRPIPARLVWRDETALQSVLDRLAGDA
jgi:tetraacyldisaccharide 4'-kinase